MKRTPLYEKHISLGAKMVDFAGWEMPVYYSGVVDEHTHTREKAGIFDVSHMGELFLRGEGAQDAVDRLVTCRIDDLAAGKCRYGFLLSEKGGIIDDMIVFKMSGEEFMLVVNAGTLEKDRTWLKKNITSAVELEDKSVSMAKLDIQGPLSPRILSSLANEEAISGLARFSFANVEIGGREIIVSRTGYTGETGYELFIPRDDVLKIWDRVLSFEEIKPVGLGARDTLRLEMGYPLYGNEIEESVTPFDAGLGKFVYMDKDFVGKDSLTDNVKDAGKRVLSGFVAEGRRIARRGFNVEIDGEICGTVTSGAFSPCLKKAIGLSYISGQQIEKEKEIVLVSEDIRIKARISGIPFIRKS